MVIIFTSFQWIPISWLKVCICRGLRVLHIIQLTSYAPGPNLCAATKSITTSCSIYALPSAILTSQSPGILTLPASIAPTLSLLCLLGFSPSSVLTCHILSVALACQLATSCVLSNPLSRAQPARNANDSLPTQETAGISFGKKLRDQAGETEVEGSLMVEINVVDTKAVRKS